MKIAVSMMVLASFLLVACSGPQGPQGQAGPPGEKAAKGDQGSPGPAGPKGDQGSPGPAGSAGSAGLRIVSGGLSRRAPPMGPGAPQEAQQLVCVCANEFAQTLPFGGSLLLTRVRASSPAMDEKDCGQRGEAAVPSIKNEQFPLWHRTNTPWVYLCLYKSHL